MAEDTRLPGDSLCNHLTGTSIPHATGPLTVEESLVLASYLGTILLLIAGPTHLPCCPRKPRWWAEKVVYAPLLGLACLSLVNFMRGQRHSLVSSQAVTETCRDKIPIILLIQSFAYLSISLDMSGFFKASATYVVRAAKCNGTVLLISIYLLVSVMTYFTSNDCVILALTPLIIHIADCSTIQDVVPLLIVEFVAANTSAMGLLVGSPTNIILGAALDLSFVRYWLLMLLPCAVAVAVTLVMLLVVFVWCPMRGHVMPAQFAMKDNGKDEDDDVEKPAPPPPQEYGMPSVVAADTLANASPRSTHHQDACLMTNPRTRRAKVLVFAAILLLLSISNYVRMELWAVSFVSAGVMLILDLIICHRDNKSKISFLHSVSARIPWAIAPFVLCMFILVRVLTDVGFTGRLAGLMIAAAGDSVWSQALVFGYASAGLVNVLNDLPSR